MRSPMKKWFLRKACLSDNLGQEEISTVQVQYGYLTWVTLYGLWSTSDTEFKEEIQKKKKKMIYSSRKQRTIAVYLRHQAYSRL